MKDCWHDVCMLNAFNIAKMSKDPSTQVGTVVISPDRKQIRYGYNGFPTRLYDEPSIWENRDSSKGLTKYDCVIHSEMNAIMAQHQGWTAYCTHIPCVRCAIHLIQSGIIEIYYSLGESSLNMDIGPTRKVCELTNTDLIHLVQV